MQSIFQYRRLGHRLRLEYENNHEKLIALSRSTQDSSNSSFIDILQTSSNDIEKALTAHGELGSAGFEGVFQSDLSSASNSCPNLEVSASKPGISRRDLTLARSVEGVTVRDRSDTEMDDEKVFVVGVDIQDKFNPQNWTRSSRMWTMCVLPT